MARHLPKLCDVFLGGYVFDLKGDRSDQIDVIVTSGHTPRFQLSGGNRYIAPLEGTIGTAEVKSQLNKNSLEQALLNCASVPPMPTSQGLVAPYLKVSDQQWQDTPYKIIFAYDGIDQTTLCSHIADFYANHEEIPTFRRPDLIHVLEKYMIVRVTSGMVVTNPGGIPDPSQPSIGQYYPFSTGSDASAMLWTLNSLQQKSFLCNHLLFKYDEWHTQIMARIQNSEA